MPTSNASTGAGSEQLPAEVRVWVWDPFIRIFHWSLAGLFMFALLTGDEWSKPHEVAGYIIAGLVAMRVLWGFIGSRHARFSGFVRGPSQIARFLLATLKLRAPRYIGHNPAGGTMVVALLLAISLICVTGHLMTTEAFWAVEWVEEVHEAATWGTVGLIVLHVLGVAAASSEHSENLIRTMFTGRKRT